MYLAEKVKQLVKTAKKKKRKEQECTCVSVRGVHYEVRSRKPF